MSRDAFESGAIPDAQGTATRFRLSIRPIRGRQCHALRQNGRSPTVRGLATRFSWEQGRFWTLHLRFSTWNAVGTYLYIAMEKMAHGAEA